MKEDTTKTYRDLAVARFLSRHDEAIAWFPLPAFIGFALVLLLIGQIMPGLNPRLGHHAEVINFETAPQPEGAIWVSLTPIGDELVVATGDRHVFRWPLGTDALAPLEPFIEYLRKTAEEEVMSAALAKQSTHIQSTVVIAADERLTYEDVKPVLMALAEGGISDYAFETRMVRMNFDTALNTH